MTQWERVRIQPVVGVSVEPTLAELDRVLGSRIFAHSARLGPRRSAKVIHFCSFKVTHTKNRIFRGLERCQRYHPRGSVRFEFPSSGQEPCASGVCSALIGPQTSLNGEVFDRSLSPHCARIDVGIRHCPLLSGRKCGTRSLVVLGHFWRAK